MSDHMHFVAREHNRQSPRTLGALNLAKSRELDVEDGAIKK
jgi:hypothetical protein